MLLKHNLLTIRSVPIDRLLPSLAGRIHLLCYLAITITPTSYKVRESKRRGAQKWERTIDEGKKNSQYLKNQILQFYYQIAESYSQCLTIRHLNLKASRGDYNLESRPSLLCPPSDFDQKFDLLYCSWQFDKGKKRGEVCPAFL